MIGVIKSISDLLCRDQVTVQDVSKALGKVTGGGESGVPIKVQPSDPAIQEARVVREGETDAVSHVDLTPARPFPMDDLIAAFGPYHATPRLPNPKQPPRVRFDVRPAGMARTAAIFASYKEGDHDADDGTVIGVMIRRD